MHGSWASALPAGSIPQAKESALDPVKAVAWFFDDSSGEKMATGGYVEDWPSEKIRSVAGGITLCATGTRPDTLSLTISDNGEGQTPRRLPDTILSLNKSNKLYIPFVQGQFNQGGTGALRFCGRNNIQLVISRRNPAILNTSCNENDLEWGFDAIVRRERPVDGKRRNSVYTYLAPCDILELKDHHHGKILSFRADQFGIFPDKEGPYSRTAEFGTCIKLYEYQYIGEKSNILRGKSLPEPPGPPGLPEIALPGAHVCTTGAIRGVTFMGLEAARTTLFGLRRRLLGSENVEQGFPLSIPFSPDVTAKLVAHRFAFKRAGSLRDREDDENDAEGQAKKRLGGLRGYREEGGHSFRPKWTDFREVSPKDFFRRDSLKMKPLADDLLVFVDCDELKRTLCGKTSSCQAATA